MVVHSGDERDVHPEEDEGDEGTDDETPVDHGIWSEAGTLVSRGRAGNKQETRI